MNATPESHPLNLGATRLSVARPEQRVDRQGDLGDAERVERAVNGFLSDINYETATYLESCIHCGLCAEVCPFYRQTGDPRYTPIWKLEPFKQAYKREAGPFAFAFKLLNLKHRVSAD